MSTTDEGDTMKLRPPKGSTNVTFDGVLVGDAGCDVPDFLAPSLIRVGWTRIEPPKPPKKTPTPTKDDPK